LGDSGRVAQWRAMERQDRKQGKSYNGRGRKRGKWDDGVTPMIDERKLREETE